MITRSTDWRSRPITPSKRPRIWRFLCRRAAEAGGLLALTVSAAAWEAGLEDGLCTLRHSAVEGEVLLTFDPGIPLYSITLTTPEPWPDAPVFAMRFEGGAALTITTDRHSLSEDGRALTVTDRGFGNVLDGLALNQVATGLSGAAAMPMSLEGAAEAVAIFRDCGVAPAV